MYSIIGLLYRKARQNIKKKIFHWQLYCEKTLANELQFISNKMNLYWILLRLLSPLSSHYTALS